MKSFDFKKTMSTMARERLEVSAIGSMIKLVIEHGAISFTAGEPSADLLPADLLAEAFEGVFDDAAQLGYYRSDLGHVEFRDWIVEWMRRDGLIPGWVKTENIMMTCGSQEGISLAGEALIDPGCYVLVESPTYMETLLTFRKQGAVCLGVPIDEDGIDIGALEDILRMKKIRFLYSIPNFQNPSGNTATLERRKEVLALLQKYDVPLLEDDPYHYLSYDSATPASYICLAGDDARVVYLGSFSKIVAPGVRCGWMVVPDSLIAEITSLRVNSCLGLPTMVQQGMLNLLTRLDLESYIGRLCSAYAGRRDALLSALDAHLSGEGLVHNRPLGGFFIWGRLEGIKDMSDFSRYAVVNEKIGVIPGSVFFVPGAEDPSSVRFSFAKVDKAKAEEGSARLARAIKSYRS
ncbi:MAG: PLP-dependent aminotransferase family protein [Synergistaceae bacterium]|jgi:2-aminoadipate transaminase|nr:PLP-dependent aminotransferase family protein [Synergistaceae bacterium]